MAKADGSHGHSQGDVAAASCEIPSSLDEKLQLDIWLPCFQTGFFFLAVPLQSCFIKEIKEQITLLCWEKGREEETIAQIFFRGYLRCFSDDGRRGVCQEVESHSVIPEP